MAGSSSTTASCYDKPKMHMKGQWDNDHDATVETNSEGLKSSAAINLSKPHPDQHDQSHTREASIRSVRKVYNIVLIGESGAGKSSFINLMCNLNAIRDLQYCSTEQALFEKCNDIPVHIGKSEVELQQPRSVPIQTKEGIVDVIIHDTPGLGAEDDQRNLKEIQKMMKTDKHVDCVCLIMNGRRTRLHPHFKSVLTKISTIIQATLSECVFVILTNVQDEFQLTVNIDELRQYGIETENNIFYLENPYCQIQNFQSLPDSFKRNELAGSLRSSVKGADTTVNSLISRLTSVSTLTEVKESISKHDKTDSKSNHSSSKKNNKPLKLGDRTKSSKTAPVTLKVLIPITKLSFADIIEHVKPPLTFAGCRLSLVIDGLENEDTTEVIRSIMDINAEAKLSFYVIVFTSVTLPRANELCKQLESTQLISQVAYCYPKKNEATSDTIFNQEVQPFVVAISGCETNTKSKRSDFFSSIDMIKELITCFTSEGDYILTNNPDPCIPKIAGQNKIHTIIIAMENAAEGPAYDDNDIKRK